IVGVGSGEVDGMAHDHSTRRRAGRLVRLVLQPFDDHADQRPDAEVGRPRVRAREPELGQLVLYPGQEPGVVAATALSILAAVGIPTVGCQRAAPAVGLFVARLEEGLDRLVSRGRAPIPAFRDSRWDYRLRLLRLLAK